MDFDNTIVSYDEVMHRVALERGLIPTGMPRNKRAIRDHIRRLPDGEEEWTRLQAVVYGPRLDEAQIIPNVQPFFSLCFQRHIELYVISHKSEFAEYDESGTNLRLAALHWMTNHGFFEPEALGLSRRHVFFEATREDKISTIRRLRCTHFIDDLEEVFLEPSFPVGVDKILYSPEHQGATPLDIKVVRSWGEITECIFP